MIAKEGGVPLILQAMKDYATHAGVQENACRALTNLAVNADNKILIAKEGGVPLILQAMKDYTTHAGVQEYACRSLWNLASNNADNQILIAKEGGVPLILQAMKEHATHAGVQEYGCRALLHACCTTQAHWKIAKEHNAKALLEEVDTKKAKEALEKM